jgi:3-hydroxyisobutyrate dehydrogenase-like beta-hydroxyacid dehydrogenase
MAERRYDGKSSQLATFTVYLDLIEVELRRSAIDAPLARAAVALYRQAIAAGFGANDMACIYGLIAPPQR